MGEGYRTRERNDEGGRKKFDNEKARADRREVWGMLSDQQQQKALEDLGLGRTLENQRKRGAAAVCYDTDGPPVIVPKPD